MAICLGCGQIFILSSVCTLFLFHTDLKTNECLINILPYQYFIKKSLYKHCGTYVPAPQASSCRVRACAMDWTSPDGSTHASNFFDGR